MCVSAVREEKLVTSAGTFELALKFFHEGVCLADTVVIKWWPVGQILTTKTQQIKHIK